MPGSVLESGLSFYMNAGEHTISIHIQTNTVSLTRDIFVAGHESKTRHPVNQT